MKGEGRMIEEDIRVEVAIQDHQEEEVADHNMTRVPTMAQVNKIEYVKY